MLQIFLLFYQGFTVAPLLTRLVVVHGSMLFGAVGGAIGMTAAVLAFAAGQVILAADSFIAFDPALR